MSFDDFMKIATYMKTAYPNSRVLPDDPSIMLWFRMLEDLDFKECENAILQHASESKFPPSISEIRQKCAKSRVDIPDWAEAWEKVQKAIRYYGAYRDDEAMESLDEVTRTAVRRMGYKSLCYSDIKNSETDRAQFREIYNLVAQPMITDSRMPPAILEEREAIRRRYIGTGNCEAPKQIRTEELIETERSHRADPVHVERLLSGFRDSMYEKG